MDDESFNIGSFIGAGLLGQTWLIQGLADRQVITPLHATRLLRAIGKASKSDEVSILFANGAKSIIAHRRHKKGPRRK